MMFSHGVHGGVAGISKRSGLAKLGPANYFTDTLLRQMLNFGPLQQQCARTLSVKTTNPARPVWRARKTITHDVIRAQTAFRLRTGLHGGGMTQQRGIWFGWIIKTLRISWTFRFRPGKGADHNDKPHTQYETDEAHPFSHTPSNHTSPNHASPNHKLASSPAADSTEVDSTEADSTAASHIQSNHKSTNHKSLSKIPFPSEEVVSNGESLTTEQNIVLDFVLHQGKSVFFTGPAGTGKSFLLRKIIAALRVKYISKPGEVTVTASTGIAATNIGGQTLHSFAGVGLGTGTAEELLTKIKKDKKKRKLWKTVKVLIIDEISMIDGEFFDKLDQIARGVRGSRLPFGGLQLVVTGDFYQLPPVSKTLSAMFAFESESWKSTIDHTICLTHVFRQKDPIFTGMLNELREACLSSNSIQRFRSLDRPLNLSGGLEPSKLFPLRSEVDRENNAKLDRLLGDIQEFKSHDWGTASLKAREQLLSGCVTPKLLRLKKGAQVMLTKNLSTTLVNGTLGKVLGFAGKASFRSKQPWIQGDWSYSENPGGPDAIDKDDTPYPVVRFTCVDGSTHDRLCSPERWTIEERVRSEPDEEPKTEILAGRIQVPLILAWALSIHKSQGQSLDFVRVDLGRVFERGQAYVALSRATSMDGLQVLNFDPGKVRTHQKVKDFYQSLSFINTGNTMVQNDGSRKEKKDGKKKKQRGLGAA